MSIIISYNGLEIGNNNNYLKKKKTGYYHFI